MTTPPKLVTMKQWTEWYNNWFYERFHVYPEEGKAMVTEEATKEAEALKTDPAPTFEEMKAELAATEEALKAAGTAHETDKILELAATLTKQRAAVLKAQKDVNKGAILAIEETLKVGIQTLVENVNYEELTGEKVKNVLWFSEVNAETQETTVGLRVNAARRPASTGAAASGNGRSVKANQTVTRTMPDGTVESLTVKEVVQTYADEDTRNSSLFEPKKAWSILFPKVNKTLDPAFSEPV